MSDWWGADPVSSSGPLKITVHPSSAKSDGEWWAGDPAAPKGPPGYTEDIAKSIPSGLAKGAAGLVGLPGDVQSAISAGLDWLEKTARQEGDDDFAKRVAERKAKIGNVPSLLPGSAAVKGAVEQVTGPLYEPQTTPGKFTGKVAEFVPGAMSAPGSLGRKLVNFAVAPGVADEAAGQLTKGTKAEPWARPIAAVAAGGIASVLNRPATAERALRGAMSADVTPQAITHAEQLMNDAAQRGVRLTWAEALEQVAPGSGLTNTQRIVESSPGGRDVMTPFMAQRPAQMDNAARQTFDTVAPQNAAPSSIGPAAGTVADSAIGEVRQTINQTARPFYDAASTVRLTPQEMARVRALPGFEEARAAVRDNPQLNRYVANLPEDSVGFLNEVKKQLDNQSTNAASRFHQNRNQQVAAGYGQDANAVRTELVDSYFSQPARNYETALNIESHGRERFLQPLLDGPIGQIAKRDITTKRAIGALFPANPVANSEHEITTAVGILAARNQRVARDLVRAHAETTFNEAAQALQGGANQFGGAKFASVIAGNPQQRANLEAAVRALPNGDQVWTGFNRFLDIAQATGTRQPKGSLTAFNAQEIKDASTGGMVAGAAKMAASPNKLLSAVNDSWSRWQYGRNMNQLAEILTDQRSGNLLRAIASSPVGGRQAQALAGQLVATVQTSRQGHSRNQQ
jgi:hypothetical protein